MQHWIVPIVVALAAPFFAFLTIAWKLSGRIATSEASELWEEARAIREDYKKRIKECENRNQQLVLELQHCIDKNAELRRKINNGSPQTGD